MLQDNRPQPDPGSVALADHPDPRVAAFAKMVAAVDAHDSPACLRATRDLRRLGFSVCVTGAATSGGPAGR